VDEAEWLACQNPEQMLEFLHGRAGGRKLRLFACSCARPTWRRLGEAACREVTAAAERIADGLAWAGDATLVRARVLERAPRSSLIRVLFPQYRAALAPLAADPATAAREALLGKPERPADTLRCLFGNPFCPVTVDPTWRAADVLRLADAIYAERAFDRLPVLADLLEEAGATDATLLAHLRGPGPHALGCHALDAVLGKE
jgi:hypothetical protein